MDEQQRPITHTMFHGEQGTTINIHDGNFTQHNHQQVRHRGFNADRKMLISSNISIARLTVMKFIFQTDSTASTTM